MRAYKLAYHIRRFIPSDFRKLNYQLSEYLFYESFTSQLEGKPWDKIFWAARDIQKLKIPVTALIEANSLHTLKNIGKIEEAKILNIYQKLLK
jgi:hypothetical protein